jgi:hypothetical protein
MSETNIQTTIQAEQFRSAAMGLYSVLQEQELVNIDVVSLFAYELRSMNQQISGYSEGRIVDPIAEGKFRERCWVLVQQKLQLLGGQDHFLVDIQGTQPAVELVSREVIKLAFSYQFQIENIQSRWERDRNNVVELESSSLEIDPNEMVVIDLDWDNDQSDLANLADSKSAPRLRYFTRIEIVLPSTKSPLTSLS